MKLHVDEIFKYATFCGPFGYSVLTIRCISNVCAIVACQGLVLTVFGAVGIVRAFPPSLRDSDTRVFPDVLII